VLSGISYIIVDCCALIFVVIIVSLYQLWKRGKLVRTKKKQTRIVATFLEGGENQSPVTASSASSFEYGQAEEKRYLLAIRGGTAVKLPPPIYTPRKVYPPIPNSPEGWHSSCPELLPLTMWSTTSNNSTLQDGLLPSYYKTMDASGPVRY
jgi:hypothetical protein